MGPISDQDAGALMGIGTLIAMCDRLLAAPADAASAAPPPDGAAAAAADAATQPPN